MADKKRRKLLGALLFIDLLSKEDEEPKKRHKRLNWVRPWLARREQRGIYHLLVKELILEDETSYRDFFRTNIEQFQFLVDAIAKRIAKNDTVMRASIGRDITILGNRGNV